MSPPACRPAGEGGGAASRPEGAEHPVTRPLPHQDPAQAANPDSSRGQPVNRKRQLLVPISRLVDPNTFNLDPDPGFWPNLDPDPEFCY